MTLVTRAEFARMQGWSRPYVTKLVKTGRVSLIDGLIETETAIDEIAANRNPQQDPSRAPVIEQSPENQYVATPKAGKISYIDAKTIHETYRARHAKLDYERSIGKLVERVAVEQVVEDVIITLKSALENIPSRVASELVGRSVPEIERHLRGEITRALSDLQREVKKQIDAAAKN